MLVSSLERLDDDDPPHLLEPAAAVCNEYPNNPKKLGFECPGLVSRLLIFRLLGDVLVESWVRLKRRGGRGRLHCNIYGQQRLVHFQGHGCVMMRRCSSYRRGRRCMPRDLRIGSCVCVHGVLLGQHRGIWHFADRLPLPLSCGEEEDAEAGIEGTETASSHCSERKSQFSGSLMP